MNNFFSKLIIKNQKTMRPSYTTTAFISGFAIICIKLLLSGITIHSYKMSDVSITDWSAGVAALSAMWISNKHINNIQVNKEKTSQIKQEKDV